MPSATAAVWTMASTCAVTSTNWRGLLVSTVKGLSIAGSREPFVAPLRPNGVRTRPILGGRGTGAATRGPRAAWRRRAGVVVAAAAGADWRGRRSRPQHGPAACRGTPLEGADGHHLGPGA